MLVLIIFALITYFGYLVSSLLLKDLSILERLGLSYLLGVGLVTQVIFVTSWAGIRITSGSVLETIIILIAILILVGKLLKRRVDMKLPNIWEILVKLKWYEKVIGLVIVSTLLVSLLIASYYPVNVWDALALYDFVAKVIAQNGYFVQIASQFYYFAQYPLFVSLTHAIVYLAGGNNPQFTYSLYFIAFAMVFFSSVRKISTMFVALLATLLVVINPTLFSHSTIAYTNLPYTIFYVIGIIYFYTAVMHDRNDYLIMSSVFIGLSTWTRSLESLWIVEILAVVIYSFYKKNITPFLMFALPFFALRQPWNTVQLQIFGDFYSTAAQFSAVGKIFTVGIDLGRVIEVIVYTYRNVILPWGPIFVLFLIAVYFEIKNHIKKQNLVMLLLVFGNFLALVAGTYFFSIKYDDWRDVAGSAARLSMFFIPLIIYSICLITSNASTRKT